MADTTMGPRTPDVGALARDDDRGALERVRAVTWLMDKAHVDPIVGLFLPGVGDVLGGMVGLFVIGTAVRMGVAPIVIARMLLNLAIDALLGVVPVVGDLGDFAFRAHKRNLELLESRAAAGKGSWKDWLLVVGALLLFIGAFALMIWLAYRILVAIF